MKDNFLNRAAFLDRDGVINRSIVLNGKPYAPRTLEEFEIIPGVDHAIKTLKKMGFLTIVVTNQPDVGNSLVSKEFVESLHRELKTNLLIDDIKVCYHNQQEACLCRKPKPGMILEAALEHAIDLSKSVMIGDRFGDIIAGRDAGCRTIFIDYGYAEQSILQGVKADITAGSLAEAVQLLMKSRVI